MTDWPM